MITERLNVTVGSCHLEYYAKPKGVTAVMVIQKCVRSHDFKNAMPYPKIFYNSGHLEML